MQPFNADQPIKKQKTTWSSFISSAISSTVVSSLRGVIRAIEGPPPKQDALLNPLPNGGFGYDPCNDAVGPMFGNDPFTAEAATNHVEVPGVANRPVVFDAVSAPVPAVSPGSTNGGGCTAIKSSIDGVSLHPTHPINMPIGSAASANRTIHNNITANSVLSPNRRVTPLNDGRHINFGNRTGPLDDIPWDSADDASDFNFVDGFDFVDSGISDTKMPPRPVSFAHPFGMCQTLLIHIVISLIGTHNHVLQ